MKHALIFGEILFDCLPDGQEILGGAPFNVAWHLQGFGTQPMMLSSVGGDDRGETALRMIRDWGMQTKGIQISTVHPTGVADIFINKETGEHEFDLKPERAYDHIDFAPFETFDFSDFTVLYHGTLALRCETSHSTLEKLQEVSNLPIFVDLNLRSPWWEPQLLPEVLRRARWVKLNRDELSIVAGRQFDGRDDLLGTAKAIASEYQLEQLIVTLGADGAFLVDDSGTVFQADSTVESNDGLVDTIGAGDAFSSVCLMGIANNWDPKRTLERAVSFAAKICGISGATKSDTSLYSAQLESWG